MQNNRAKKEFKLWQKCLITFLVLLVYRILCTVPTPGVNRDYFNLLINSNTSLGLLNAFSGNSLSSLSIMALNITPYISATIIVQLLETSIESLKRLARGTKKDRDKITILTVVITAIFALAESLGMALTFGRNGMLVNFSVLWVCIITLIWTGTAIILAILGKKMDDNKNLFVGRGISLFLVTNIIASFPSNLREVYNTFIAGKTYAVIWSIVGFVGLLVLFTIISFLHESEKRIVVSYTSNVVYDNGEDTSFKQIIPIKLMPASVMPVIFASAIFSVPVLVVALTGHSDLEWVKYLNTSEWFNPNNMIYSLGCILYVILTFVFSYFYIDISLNPYELAEDLQKAGGFISGLKTNTETAKYLKKNIYQMASVGAVILSVISVVPFVLSGIFGLSKMSFMGTSVLIIVATILETYRDIKASKIAENHTKKAGGLFDEI